MSLYSEGKRRYVLIHRLVAKYFVDNPLNKPHVNHIDGDKTNNKSKNLEWVTPYENTRHACDAGLYKGLTTSQIKLIRELYRDLTTTEISKLLNIPVSTITTHVKDLESHNKLKSEKIKEIQKLYETNKYYKKEIATMCGVNVKSVTKYVNEGELC